MKLTCATEYLRDGVLSAERFTGRHVTLPILGHVLIAAREKQLISISATNLEVGIDYTISGKVQRPGMVTAPAKTFSQLLQSIHDEQVVLEAKAQSLTLHTPSSDITLLGLNPEEFPTLPEIKVEQSFSLPALDFRRALTQVLPAAATTDLKPELAGVLVAAGPSEVVFAATDSFRLAEKTIPLSGGRMGGSLELIVPARTMHELLRTLPEEGSVSVSAGEHQALFTWGGTRVLSRLIDGAYPPYRNIIPQAYEAALGVARGALLEKIRLAAVFSSRLNDVTLRFSAAELEVTSMSTEAGQTTSRLPAKGRGAAGAVVFNHRYLLDGVEAVGGEYLNLNLNGVSGPALITSPTDASYRYLLMPIRSV